MVTDPRLDLRGVNPAPVLPLTPGGAEIDEADLRAHLEGLVAVDGVTGLVMNGHAGEVYGLSSAERERVVEIAADIVDDAPLVAGVVAGATRGVIGEARTAVAAGADGLLVIPPHTPISGRRDAAVGFFEALSDAVDAPLVIFQHPTWAGGHYPSDVLADLVRVEGVVAVKDAVWDVDHFQADVRAIRDAGEDVQVLVANDEHLLPSFALRADGTILELAAVIPDRIVSLLDAVHDSDLDRARAEYERIEPFVDAMYEPPVTDSHTRLKVALELQGVIGCADPRPPAAPIPADEVDSIERAMAAADLL